MASSTNGEEAPLTPGYHWPYPYPPYDIQIDLMRAMRKTLDLGNCGIFESPTGTGKTSSIICSVVPWLLENWAKGENKTEVVGDQPAWILEHEIELRRQNQARVQFLRKRRDARYVRAQDEYKSNGGSFINIAAGKRTKRGGNRVSFETIEQEAIASDDDDEDIDEETLERNEECDEFKQVRKLYYCSRTHTQLSQFLAEVKKVYPNREVSCVTLGSRSHLCVNDEVKKKHKHTRLNDACLDLQESTTTEKCPYLRDPRVVRMLADAQLYDVEDVEDLLVSAKDKQGCAYYASREASKTAQIVVLPYSALLQSTTREALGIDLTDSIVVCDEAHNLVDAIADIHSCQVTLAQLQSAKHELKAYLDKYSKRFNLDNAAFLAELASVANKLAQFLEKKENLEKPSVLPVDAFLCRAKIEDNNLYELVKKARDAQLNKKLKGVAREMQKENTAILPVISFLDALKDVANDGRVSISPATQSMRFLLLNPQRKFQEICEQAHSVILTGGTMHPVEDVVQQLFTPNSTVDLFSCGHIVPRENLRVFQIGTGPSNRELRLTFGNRNDVQTLDEIANCVRSVCQVVPEGVVVFLPSYTFQEILLARWETTGFLKSLKKSFVTETRSGGNDACESTFQQYERLVMGNPNGCLLLAVVGGKLSEGINFSDHLARCVVMVGMPYPNKFDCELAARMEFIEQQQQQGAGNRYFENQCWKAVNQSVGRSIRHRNDYACVLFLDTRFASCQKKLPKWIGERFERCDEWDKVVTGLGEFFQAKPRRVQVST